MSILYGISDKNNSKPYNAESTRYENKEIRIVRKYFQVNKGDLRIKKTLVPNIHRI